MYEKEAVIKVITLKL